MPSDLGRLIEFKVTTLLALSICATALTAFSASGELKAEVRSWTSQ
jgi:hypothetical protein